MDLAKHKRWRNEVCATCAVCCIVICALVLRCGLDSKVDLLLPFLVDCGLAASFRKRILVLPLHLLGTHMCIAIAILGTHMCVQYAAHMSHEVSGPSSRITRGVGI